MKRCIAMMVAFGVLMLALPLLTAQDADKKDADKKDVEKKDVEKKDDAKKDDSKKDAAKKDDEPKKKEDGKDEPEKKKSTGGTSKAKTPKEPLPKHGPVLSGVKLKAVDSAESRAFTIEILAPDPLKMAQNQQWQMQRMFQIQQGRNNPAQYFNDLRNFQMEMMQRQAQAVSWKEIRLQASDATKFRIMQPATEYDEKGNLKKWSKKDLDALRGNTDMPGYPAEFDALRQGQFLNVYLPPLKAAPKTSGSPMPKKKLDDDDPAMNAPPERQDTVLIVIVGDPNVR
ncbi:MAG: hypothetical protein K2X38_21350 [Gemmataceae bacterium]|nr:hypothetical protein [Gemmataceae bacterium]